MFGGPLTSLSNLGYVIDQALEEVLTTLRENTEALRENTRARKEPTGPTCSCEFPAIDGGICRLCGKRART